MKTSSWSSSYSPTAIVEASIDTSTVHTEFVLLDEYFDEQTVADCLVYHMLSVITVITLEQKGYRQIMYVHMYASYVHMCTSVAYGSIYTIICYVWHSGLYIRCLNVCHLLGYKCIYT